MGTHLRATGNGVVAGGGVRGTAIAPINFSLSENFLLQNLGLTIRILVEFKGKIEILSTHYISSLGNLHLLALQFCNPRPRWLQSVTCHIESQSVTCHPTQVNVSRLNPVRRFAHPRGMEGRVNLINS